MASRGKKSKRQNGEKADSDKEHSAKKSKASGQGEKPALNEIPLEKKLPKKGKGAQAHSDTPADKDHKAHKGSKTNPADTDALTSHELGIQLAQMLKGGVIMDVSNAEQARIAEAAGACAVMALERIPSDIRKEGGVARMSDPKLIKEIQSVVSIPVMAKARIGHFVEAQILEALEIDFIDESEVLTPVDEHHIDKSKFKVPFVCGCKNLGEALRRIAEGAVMIRTKGEAGTGNVVEAVRHARTLNAEIKQLQGLDSTEVFKFAKDHQAPLDLVLKTRELGRLPVVNFAAGGIATPADAALMMQFGMDGVFVGSGIFKSEDPAKMARAIVQAVTHFRDAHKLAEVSEGLGDPMKGLEINPKKIDMYSTRETT